MAQVFISYAKTDRISAESLARQLTDRGFDVWWDFQLYTGDDFHDVIREEIHKAKAVIVIWSEAAVASQWVRGEAQEAFDLKKLVPTHLTGFDPKRVPLNFRALHIESVGNFDALVRAIERKGASVRAPKPAAPPQAERTQAATQPAAAPSGPSEMTPAQMEQMLGGVLCSTWRRPKTELRGSRTPLSHTGRAWPRQISLQPRRPV